MRLPKPWFRADKGCWYARIDGRRVSLGIADPKATAKAHAEWRRLMAEPKPVPRTTPEPKPDATVQGVIDAFLASAQSRVKPATHRWYGFILKPYADADGKMPAATLTAEAVEAYMARQQWGQSTRHGFAGILLMAFRWAEREGVIPSNPLKRLRRPAMRSRGEEAIISPADHKRLLAKASATLKPLLVLLHETGARPSELARLTAKDIDFTHGIARLHQHKTGEKTGKPRIIVLSAVANKVLKPLAKERTDGPLLRNRLGIPWTKDAICLAFRRLAKRAGVKATAYGYRHTFATDALANGLPDATVAALLGHSSTAMLHKHYAHLTAKAQAMREALGSVR